MLNVKACEAISLARICTRLALAGSEVKDGGADLPDGQVHFIDALFPRPPWRRRHARAGHWDQSVSRSPVMIWGLMAMT
jgi:hypothetical protein